MTILLRKVRGVSGLTPLLRRDAPFFVSGGGSLNLTGLGGRLLGLLLSPMVLTIVAVMLAGAWLMAHPASPELAALLPFGFAGMADSTALVEKREALKAKQKDIGEVLELAGPDLDFSRDTVLKRTGAPDAAQATKVWQDWNKEAEQLGTDLKRSELAHDAAAFREREEELKRPAGSSVMKHYDGNGERKSWRRLFVEAKGYHDSRQSRQNFDFPLTGDFREAIGMKTLMTTAAGWAPESTRTDLLVEARTRPIQVLDLIPDSPTTQAAVVYMEETTRTHSAAETAEGAAYPESAFVLAPQTSQVRKIADSIPATDEQLEDVSFVENYLMDRLSFGLRQRFDSQVLVGNGTAPNLRGINAVVGIQTLAKGALSEIEAFATAMNMIRVTGRAIPNGAVFHPNDWLSVFLTKTAAGEFIFGNPFQGPGPTSIFGVRTVQSDAQTENTVLVGDFQNFSRIFNRRGVRQEWGYVGTQFTEGEITLRADLRVAFVVTRPTAFIQITGM